MCLLFISNVPVNFIIDNFLQQVKAKGRCCQAGRDFSLRVGLPINVYFNFNSNACSLQTLVEKVIPVCPIKVALHSVL